MEKLLTIVIPSYNMEKLLSKCIESVLVEDRDLLDLLDVIVVNDGSTDGTSAIGHRYAALHPNSVRVVDKENGHHGSCVNCGLKMARGRFIRILDADDYFDKAAFERSIRKLLVACEKQISVDVVIMPFKMVRPDGSTISTSKWDILENVILDDKSILELARKLMRTAGPPTLTYSTELLRNIGYHQTEKVAYSDVEWSFSPFAAIKHCIYVNEFVYFYLIGREGQSMSKSERIRNFDSLKVILRNMAQLYEIIKVDTRFDETILMEKIHAFLCWVFGTIVFLLPISSVRPSIHEVLGIIRQYSPELESAAMSMVVSRIFHFRYVKFIDQHPKWSLPYIIMVRFYLQIALLITKIQNRGSVI